MLSAPANFFIGTSEEYSLSNYARGRAEKWTAKSRKIRKTNFPIL
jgi:hypothetical protein